VISGLKLMRFWVVVLELDFVPVLKELLWLFPQEAISGGFYKEVR
jgi:hypothetical protein